MIRSFKDKETEKIFDRTGSQRFADIRKTAFRKLRMLSNAQTLADLKAPPGNRLERLKGKRAGQHSIRINDKWRVCFVWKDGDAHDVEITDYHN